MARLNYRSYFLFQSKGTAPRAADATCKKNTHSGENEQHDSLSLSSMAVVSPWVVSILQVMNEENFSNFQEESGLHG